ncbi:DsbA family protein [Corticibacter populi]|uniref:DsbA family protein n=1 Tax=Corticibacter populi TaxID=1550736 RepID=A0A3M6QU39_9BURK|nr:thioredoxin domain-containing protein [Corticibacter populi]RMX06483.1 DsbA family protein [Corticibacter populi]RZS31960.1 protein-disulfide isomerase [Corticibacter populi]
MSTLRIPVGSHDHVTGNPEASIVLVEYGDYQCPWCGQAFPVVQRLLARHGRDVAFAFRHFPLTEAHPEAYNAAVVAEYAGAQGHFWQAHRALFENQDALGPELYAELIQSLGLDVTGLQQALDTDAFDARIRNDMEGGIRSGVNGTPSFFLNGQRFDTGDDFGTLLDAVEQLLQSR